MNDKEIIERVRKDLIKISGLEWESRSDTLKVVDKILSHKNIKIVDDNGNIIEL